MYSAIVCCVLYLATYSEGSCFIQGKGREILPGLARGLFFLGVADLLAVDCWVDCGDVSGHAGICSKHVEFPQKLPKMLEKCSNDSLRALR